MDEPNIVRTAVGSAEMTSDEKIINVSGDSLSSELDNDTNEFGASSYGSSSGWCSDSEGTVGSSERARSGESHSSVQSDSTESGYEVCYSCKDGGKLILCDGCGTSFHTLCHFPAVKEIPTGPWYCAVCSQQSTSKSESPAREGRKTPSDRPPSPDESALKNDKAFIALRKCIEVMGTRNAVQFSSSFIPDESSSSSDDDHYEKGEDADVLTRLLEMDEPKSCFYCKRFCPEGDLVDCDYCDKVFHEDCLFPLPGKRSEEKWMCPLHLEFIAQRYIRSNPLVINKLVSEVSKNESEFAMSFLRDLLFRPSEEKEEPEASLCAAKDEAKTVSRGQAKGPKDKSDYQSVSSWCRDVFLLVQMVKDEEEEFEEDLELPTRSTDYPFHATEGTDGELLRIVNKYAVVKALLERLKGPHRFNFTSLSVDFRGYDASLPVLATLKLWYSCIEVVIQQPWLTLGTMKGDSLLDLTRYCSCSRISPRHAILFLDKETSQFFILSQSAYGIIVDDVQYGRKLPDANGPNTSNGSKRRFIDFMAKRIARLDCNCADKFNSEKFIDEPVALKSGSRVRIGCLEFVFWPSWSYGDALKWQYAEILASFLPKKCLLGSSCADVGAAVMKIRKERP